MEDWRLNAFQKLQLTLYLSIWVIGTVGCLLVMFVIVFSSKLSTSTNVFLLNLAVADFVFLQGIPFLLTVLVNRQWLFSQLTCKLVWTMMGVNQYTAVFILTVLAFDRYFSFTLSLRKSFICIFMYWINHIKSKRKTI